MGHEHTHGTSAGADRRWLTASLLLLVTFMVAEVIAGLAANSLALIADAGHLLTDAGALLLAVVISRLVTRPARGRYTYGLARLDALSGQANGITLILLAVWFTVEGIRRLVEPSQVHGATVAIVALVGVAVNLVATGLARRADRSSLNVRGFWPTCTPTCTPSEPPSPLDWWCSGPAGCGLTRWRHWSSRR